MLTRGVIIIVPLVVGCAPFTPPPAIPLAETAQILNKGHVGLTGTAGGGGMFADGAAVGGDVRARVGVGANQEVGIEGSAVFVDAGNHRSGDPPWRGQSFAAAVKASWKLGLQPWAAVIAGVGPTFSATGDAMGVDFAAVFSRARGQVRPYAALRLALAIPVDHEITANGGITGGVVVPVGIDVTVTDRVHFFVEAGLLNAWNYSDQVTWHIGGYGALALSIQFARSAQLR